MKIKVFIILILTTTSLFINAQTQFKVADRLYSSLSDSLTHQIINSFDKLLISIEKERLDTLLIDNEKMDLNRNFFRYLKGIAGKDTIQNYFQAKLINLYPIGNHQYMLTMSYTKNDEIGRMLNFLAKETNEGVVFANPLEYNTKFWKTTTVGTITYFYPDTIDTERAEVFNQKNILMAKKLNIPVRNWDVYMCRNYQEAIQIQGCFYEFTRNGIFNSGDIIDSKTLFSCMNDEDFSHDVLHIYASQIRGKVRNSVAECGLAYYWGNAYHSGIAGKSPGLKELIPAVQHYLKSNKEVKLLDLFDERPDVLAEYGYPKPIQIHQIISGIICREIERQKGVEGIIELLKSGRGDDNYFKSINKLLGINRENFNTRVHKLIFSDYD